MKFLEKLARIDTASTEVDAISVLYCVHTVVTSLPATGRARVVYEEQSFTKRREYRKESESYRIF